ncbi:MAG TPA: nucleotidyltransferase family protein [Dehalococcoidia bacterium]|nr:nucleotidyltransferase family protein [Dehalococcoidia bacterium]
MKVCAILLAAGMSTRMGRPKPLLGWEGTTLIEYQIAELRAAGIDEVIVVLGHKADAIKPYVRQARVVVNEHYRSGRATSVRAGAKAVPVDVGAIVLLNVDQPRPRELIAGLLAEHKSRGGLITTPVYQNKRGHPVIFAGSLLAELREVQEESLGLRAIMEKYGGQVQEVLCESPAVLIDINTIHDYEAAKAQLSKPAK